MAATAAAAAKTKTAGEAATAEAARETATAAKGSTDRGSQAAGKDVWEENTPWPAVDGTPDSQPFDEACAAREVERTCRRRRGRKREKAKRCAVRAAAEEGAAGCAARVDRGRAVAAGGGFVG